MKPPKEIVTNKAGKPIECWHCDGNYHLANCDKTNDEVKATINAIAVKMTDQDFLEEHSLSVKYSDDKEIGRIRIMGHTPSCVVVIENGLTLAEPGTTFVGKSGGDWASSSRNSLDLNNAYLDSAALHHQVVNSSDLSNIRQVAGALHSD